MSINSASFYSPNFSLTSMGPNKAAIKTNAGNSSFASNKSEDAYQEVDFSNEDSATPDSASKSGGFNENTPLDELYTEQGIRQNTVNTEEGNVTKVVGEEDKNVEEAQKTYDEAVKNDEKVSKELKEKESKLSSKVREYEKNIADAEKNLTSAKSTVAKLDTTIATLSGQISSLEGQISSLSTNTGNAEQDKANAAAKEQYETVLQNKKTELAAAEKSRNEASEKATEYSNIVSNNTRALQTARMDLLIVENEISKSCSPETQAAREALDTARITRDTNVKTAEDTLSTAREALAEIDNLIANHKDMPPCNAADMATAILGGNTPRSYSDVSSEVNKYDPRLSLVEGEWCNGFAIYSLSKAYGGLDYIPSNTKDKNGNQETYKDTVRDMYTCYATAHWAKDNGILMDKRDDADSYDINKVKPGDFILFNTYCDGNDGRPAGKNWDEWAHIGVVTGVSSDGTEVYTIEGNTSTSDPTYSSGDSSSVLAAKTRKVDGSDFGGGNSLGTSYVLLHNLKGKISKNSKNVKK